MAVKTLTYAQAAALALSDGMQRDERVVALGEDIGRGGIFGQYAGLQASWGPERVIDTPISEATIVGAGVGMALLGLRPVVEMRVIDFALCAMDEIVNQAAKNRYMFGGQGRVPIVMRMPIGMWVNSAAQHSQSLEAWFAHLPGVVVLCPATAQDNYELLTWALQAEDPVVYLENKELWAHAGPVDTQACLPPDRARVMRRGEHLTLVAWSAAVHTIEQAADRLQAQGISASVIDLRALWPWDRATVLQDCARTGRLLVVQDAVQVAGFGAEVAATAAQETGCHVARLGAPRIPVGYAACLENLARISVDEVVSTAQHLVSSTS
jgi:pyruvate dehydrogenase E1 component beta subunit